MAALTAQLDTLEKRGDVEGTSWNRHWFPVLKLPGVR